MIRKMYLGEKIDTINLDEKAFPDAPKIKTNFYRIYGLVFESMGDHINADSFIEKAIHLNPDRFNNYIAKLSLIKNRLILSQDNSQGQQLSQELLDEIEKVERTFFQYGDVGARNKAILNINKLTAILTQENIPEFERVSAETYELLITCHFDKQIEQIFVEVFRFISLPINKLNQLLEYLRSSKMGISDDLSKVLIFQFDIRDSLLTDGKGFFEKIHNQKYFEFICDLESENNEKVFAFLDNDVQFTLNLANTLQRFPVLRNKIIENLPDEKDIQKEKLILLLNFNEKDYLEAFQILRQLDLSKLNYLECRPILQVIQQMKAREFEIIILGKLLEKERNQKEKFNLKSQLFNAYLDLKKYSEVVDIGEQLLQEDSTENLLDPRNKEALLTNTIIACFERGKFDKEVLKKAKEILEKYPLANPSFGFNVGIEAEVYLNNNDVETALESVIKGVKNKKIFSPQEYARLDLLLSVEIGNRINLNLVSLDKVQENTFVKTRNKDLWYFIGHENELDALPITEANNRHALFIDRKLGDKVIFENKYGTENREEEIELIFPIEKYVLWQAVQNFQKLSKDGDLEGVQMIEVPQIEGAIDPQYLLKFLEDVNKRTEPLFEMYCQNNLPLAMLALSEGGLTKAIGRIQQESKGFINFSTGAFDEFEMQKEIAKKVIEEKMQFYIDGTSALVLSETGLLQKIHAHLPNLKIPQSVINLLANITYKFRFMPGQTGLMMGYAQGKLTFSTVEKNKRDLIQSNFITSIKIFESNQKNIGIISSANKINCFTESKIPDELSDACILAQKENLPVLTEDFLYLN